jgi:hypothetical protein
LTSHFDESSKGLLSGEFPVLCVIYIGLPFLRPLQRDVIVAALDGSDVFVQAATGFGKSLCFQLPAVIDHGSEIVRIFKHLSCSLTHPSNNRDIASSVFDGNYNRKWHPEI